METINNGLIRSFNPCYDPSEIGIPDEETLPVVEWIEKYRNQVKAKQLLCRNEFMSDSDLRLFAVWCARTVAAAWAAERDAAGAAARDAQIMLRK